MIGVFVAAFRLAAAIRMAWPDVTPERAVEAAIASGTVDASPKMILAIAYHETRLRPALVGARGECGAGQVMHRRDRARLCSEAARSFVASFEQMADAIARIEAAECHYRHTPCVLNVYAAGSKGRDWSGYGLAAREFLSLEDRLWRAIDSIEQGVRRTGVRSGS